MPVAHIHICRQNIQELKIETNVSFLFFFLICFKKPKPGGACSKLYHLGGRVGLWVQGFTRLPTLFKRMFESITIEASF